MLFEVAMIMHPTQKEKEDGVMEKLIMEPEPVIARDEQQAAVAAVMKNKGSIECDMSRVEVLVRPFVVRGK
jgi:hypothetical protein